MDAFILMILALILVLPVVATVLAVIAYRRQTALIKHVDSIARTVGVNRESHVRLSRRVSALEQGAEIATGQPVEAPAAAPEPEPRPEPEIPEEFDLEKVTASVATPPTAPAEKPAAPEPPPPPSAQPTPPAPPTTVGLERQLGTRVAVWLGAIALALAGGFLVKYSVEQGLIGPATRIVLGLIFGVALLGVGEWIARRYAGLAQGLDAAGIAVLYAVLLAGTRLYDLYPPGVAFVGMLLTTVTAVVLSLRRGPFVALLGLLGGFLTPILIGSTEPRPWMLLVYLGLLQSGLLFVSRRMRWWPVAGLTLVGAMGWALLWMADLAAVGGETLHVALLLSVSIVSFVLAAVPSARSKSWGDARVPLALVWGAVGLGTVLLAALVGVGEFGLMEWTFFGMVGAACVVLGRIDSSYEGLAWVASLAGAAMLLLWGIDIDVSQSVGVLLALFGADLGSHQEILLWRVALALAAVFVGGSYWAMWRGAHPSRWAALASVSGTAYLLAAYATLRDDPFPIAWGLQALALAAVFVALAIPVSRRRENLAEGSIALAALAVAVTTQVSLAVPMELERAWISVAWAVEIPLLAWIASRLSVPQLSKLAWLMGGLVAVRLLLNPAVLTYPIGDGVVFNWLLYGYGIPIAAFVAGAMLFRREGSDKLANALEIGAIALGFAYITLSIRQYFHPGALDDLDVQFAEWGTWIVAWLLYGIGLTVLHDNTGRRIHRYAALASSAAAIGFAMVAPALVENPLIASNEVGETMILNRVLWVYGVPAVLAVVLARMLRRREMRVPSWIAGSAALVLGFLTLTLEVRQAFHGSLLSGGGTTNAELYTYSLVWVLFAIALLVTGIATRGTVVRYGSAAIMLIAVGKVFLVDTAQLEDLYRVMSLFGLGVTLMLLAWLYQRFVFRELSS
jgi:uncharacterized membrane protein